MQFCKACGALCNEVQVYSVSYTEQNIRQVVNTLSREDEQPCLDSLYECIHTAIAVIKGGRDCVQNATKSQRDDNASVFVVLFKLAKCFVNQRCTTLFRQKYNSERIPCMNQNHRRKLWLHSQLDKDKLAGSQSPALSRLFHILKKIEVMINVSANTTVGSHTHIIETFRDEISSIAASNEKDYNKESPPTNPTKNIKTDASPPPVDDVNHPYMTSSNIQWIVWLFIEEKDVSVLDALQLYELFHFLKLNAHIDSLIGTSEIQDMTLQIARADINTFIASNCDWVTPPVDWVPCNRPVNYFMNTSQIQSILEERMNDVVRQAEIYHRTMRTNQNTDTKEVRATYVKSCRDLCNYIREHIGEIFATETGLRGEDGTPIVRTEVCLLSVELATRLLAVLEGARSVMKKAVDVMTFQTAHRIERLLQVV